MYNYFISSVTYVTIPISPDTIDVHVIIRRQLHAVIMHLERLTYAYDR